MQPPQSIEEIKAGLETTEKGGVEVYKRQVLCQLYGGFFLSQPIQGGGKINHIPIRTTAEAVVTPIQLHAWGFIVMERAASHPVPTYMDSIVNTVIKKEGVARLINCGSIPGRLAQSMEDVKIVNQYEYMGKGRGACTFFCCKEGDVTFGTLGRIHGRYVMSIAEGQAFQEPMEKLAEVRTWAQGFVRLNCDPMKFYENLRSNHCAACYGKCMPELIEFCRIAGIEYIEN